MTGIENGMRELRSSSRALKSRTPGQRKLASLARADTGRADLPPGRGPGRDCERVLFLAGEHDRRVRNPTKPGSCRDVEGQYPTLDPTPGRGDGNGGAPIGAEPGR